MLNNTRIDNLLERQRRNLTLDTIFALIVTFSLLISVIGLSSATAATADSNLTSNQVELITSDAPGCVPASTSSDLIC